MKKKTPYRLATEVLLLLCMVLNCISCIKDDLTGCEEGIYIRLYDLYKSEETGIGLNRQEFPQVFLYIYHTDGRFIGQEILYDCQTEQEYPIFTKLVPGNYDLIVWSGIESDRYLVTAHEPRDGSGINFSQSYLQLFMPFTGTAPPEVPHLYYGRSGTITIQEGSRQVVNIPMIQDTNEIRFTIEGLAGNGESYQLSIEDNNGVYGFDNHFAPCEPFMYYTHLTAAEVMETSLTTLRLAPQRTPTLLLFNQTAGEIAYPSYDGQETNLIALIQAAYQDRALNFDARHIYEILISFNAEMIATVYVNQWQVKDDNYWLIP